MNKMLLASLVLFSQFVWANEVKVIDVKMTNKSPQHYRVDVTLLHDDTGWDHYADGWQVLDNNKQLIATRVLHHPHENEQPFTRSLYDVQIPAGIKFVYIRAHDKVHGDSELFKVKLK